MGAPGTTAPPAGDDPDGYRVAGVRNAQETTMILV